MINNDLQMALANLVSKKRRYDLLWRYYDGEQPLVYSSEKLREIFSGLNAQFTENWCSVVVDSVLDRLELRTPAVSDNEAVSAELADLWEATGLVDDELAIHEDVAVTGESFVIAWLDENEQTQAFHNDARLCHAIYDEENPRYMRVAAKWWTDPAGPIRMTLYYPDRLEYYVTKRAFKPGEVPDARAFEPWSEEPVAANPFGQIPVFHFRSNRRRTKSQLAGVIEIQDMVNKMLADMMVAAEFGAFPQRYVISAAGIKGLENNPNAIWDLVASDQGSQATQAGQFAAASLDNYLNAINKLSSDIGVISRTPRHYFYAQGGDPSGEALIAMEAPLTKKVKRLQATLLPTWRDLASFLLALGGVVVSSRLVLPAYEEAATVQPMTQALIIKARVEAGMPHSTALKTYDGWTEADIEEMEADAAAERMAQRSYADAVLSAAQADFDRGEAV
mgnify:CR=1 FL=1